MKWYKVHSIITRDIFYFGISWKYALKTLDERWMKNKFDQVVIDEVE